MLAWLAPLMEVVAHGQQPLTISEAVGRALQSHPLLAASGERVQVASGLRTQASLRPNPRFYFQTENWRPSFPNGSGAGDFTDTFSYFSQTIETAGKRARRVEAASTVVERADLEKELLARQIAARVKLAYWNAVGAQKLYELLLTNGTNFRQIIQYHEIRVREGAMAEADLLKVRLEGERLEIARNTANLEAERARIQLFREMGQTEFPSVPLAEPLDSEIHPAAADYSQALQNRTEMKLVRQAAAEADANLRLQQAYAKPNVDGIFGYKRTSGYNTMLGGIQVDLPFANRNQGNIAASQASRRVVQSEMAATEALVRAEVRAAQAEVEYRRKQVTETFKGLLERATESSRIALAAYREGGSDLLRLLDAERARIEIQLLYYRTLMEYHQSLVSLETAMGVTP